jgi:phosphopantothenoylcysteine synthetase/decarboxylase
VLAGHGGRLLGHLAVSGAPAPEGVPALVAACQGAGWRVVVFSTPAGIRFIDPAVLETLTGEPVRSEYRMPGTRTPVPAADAVLACPLTVNSVNKFAHGHADNFAVGLLREMAGYGVRSWSCRTASPSSQFRGISGHARNV